MTRYYLNRKPVMKRVNENMYQGRQGNAYQSSVKRVLKEDLEWVGGRDTFAVCIRKLNEAKNILITDIQKAKDDDESHGIYKDFDDYYDMDDFKMEREAINAIDRAIRDIEEIGLNGRIGTFDSNGYHSDGY